MYISDWRVFAPVLFDRRPSCKVIVYGFVSRSIFESWILFLLHTLLSENDKDWIKHKYWIRVSGSFTNVDITAIITVLYMAFKDTGILPFVPYGFVRPYGTKY